MKQWLETISQTVQAGSASQSPEAVFRGAAWAVHEQMGWPTRHTETWRYTTCATLLNSQLSLDQSPPELTAAEVNRVMGWSEDFDVVVLKNGALVSGACARPLDWNMLKHIAPQWTDGFAPAMAAAAKGGALIEISGHNKRPVLIVHLFDQNESGRSTLNVIQVHEGASCSLVELWDGEGRGFSSTQTFINIGPATRLSLARVVRSQPSMKHFDDCQMRLLKGAQLQFLNIHLGAEWSRSSVLAALEGPEASAQLSGISFGKDQQHSDQRVEVRHMAPHTMSRQLFKGVWRDQARGVVNGKIYIAQNAQKVDSAQLNHNLLLSSRAEVDTKPELEVYADDVKANHGASVGRMDEEKLFYFLSRGISRPQAVQLLAEGFVKDVILKLEDSFLQEWLLSEIQNILPEFSL